MHNTVLFVKVKITSRIQVDVLGRNKHHNLVKPLSAPPSRSRSVHLFGIVSNHTFCQPLARFEIAEKGWETHAIARNTLVLILDTRTQGVCITVDIVNQ
jgi:hypothetical protein